MRVQATRLLFYGGSRQQPGEFFTIADEPQRKLRPSDNAETRGIAVKGKVPRDYSQDSMRPAGTADLRNTIFDDGQTPAPDNKDADDEQI